MKNLTYSEASICWNNIDRYIWEVTLAMQKHCACGISTAESLAYPLKWYVYTGRASCDFLRLLVKTNPHMIARALADNGTSDELMEKVKELIGYESSGI